MTLVERMVVSPGVDYNITWMKMDSVSQGIIGKDINFFTETVMGDITTIVTLTFDPLRFEDRGTYICMADLNVTRTLEGGEGSDEYDIVTVCELLTLTEGSYSQTVTKSMHNKLHAERRVIL